MSKVPRGRIAAVIAKSSIGTLPGKQLANQIAAYLISQKRTSELNSLMRDIMQYRADNGIVEVQAVTAHSLSAKQRQDVEAQIKKLYPAAKRIIVSERLDSSLIGSIRLELANQQFDASLRAKLNHFRQLTTVTKG